MAILTIVADIRAKQGQAGALREALGALIPPTRAEDGCVHYDLHQDNDDPHHFLFHESWQSRDLWERHNVSDHIERHRRDNADLVESVTIWEMTKL